MLLALLLVVLLVVIFFAIPMYSVSRCAVTPGCFL